MPILDLSERLRRRPAVRQSVDGGFTLLEMLVVMAIIGLATGLVGPVLSNWFDRIVQRSELAEVMTQIRSLQNRAALLATELHLNEKSYADTLPDTRQMLHIPSGWSITPGTDMVFARTGLCGSGHVEISTNQNQRVMIGFSGPECAVSAVFAP